MSEYQERSDPVDPINEEASDWEEAGLPAQEDTTEEQSLPNDQPIAMGEFGDPGTEKEAGEPLDAALARDRPDTSAATGSTAPVQDPATPPPPADQSEGIRLVEEDEGLREDEEKNLVAEDAGEDRGAYTPEEQAMREEDEEPGAP